MNKRTKIIALISTLCFTLGLFVVGVLAVGTVSFNVTSNLSFTAEGVYVMLQGDIKQGTATSQTSLSNIKGYSYKPVSDSDAKPSGAQTDKFVTSNGSTEATWSAGTDVTFTTTENVVKYEFTFTNYTETEVLVRKSINLYALKTLFGDSNVIESKEGSIILPAYTGTVSPYTYTITIRLNDFTKSFTGEERQLNAEFVFEKYTPVYAELYLSSGSNHSNVFINGEEVTLSTSEPFMLREGDIITDQADFDLTFHGGMIPDKHIFITKFVVPELTQGVDYTLNITTKVKTVQDGASGGQGM